VRDAWERFKAERQECYWGYPEEFCERPFGSWMRAQMSAHIREGAAAQMALYRYDFADPTTHDRPEMLTARGMIQLRKICCLLNQGGQVIAIEPSGDPDLDQARRQQVFQQLALLNCPVSDGQIVTGRTQAGGLSGDEAVQIHGNRLKASGSGGADILSSRGEGSQSSSGLLGLMPMLGLE
jgi:hypothetical protein